VVGQSADKSANHSITACQPYLVAAELSVVTLSAASADPVVYNNTKIDVLAQVCTAERILQKKPGNK